MPPGVSVIILLAAALRIKQPTDMPATTSPANLASALSPSD
jgi:hypothetical protein